MANTFETVMGLARQVKEIDAQNFQAGDKLIEMLNRQVAAFNTARTEYATTIGIKDATIAQRNAEYASLNERNVEVNRRLNDEQSARQAIAAQLSTTNTLLAETITDVNQKAELLRQADIAATEARSAFEAEKTSLNAVITDRNNVIVLKDSAIETLNTRAEQMTTEFQNKLDAIAEQFREILEANVSEDADVREIAETGAPGAWVVIPGSQLSVRRQGKKVVSSVDGVSISGTVLDGVNFAFVTANGVFAKMDDGKFHQWMDGTETILEEPAFWAAQGSGSIEL